MRATRRRAHVFVAGLLAFSGAAFAPRTPTAIVGSGESVRMRSVTRSGVSSEMASEMTSVSAVRELRDGRAVVLDATSRSLFLFDFLTSRTTRISGEGAGPREYSRPSHLIALGGDSTLVYDPGNQRYLVLGPGGQPIGSIPEFEYRDERRRSHEVAVRGADERGRLYFSLPRVLARRGDQTPILRFDRRSYIADTVGTITEGEDDWVVLPEGGIAIARAEPFRVEYHPADGEAVIGEVVPYRRARVNGIGPALLLAPNGRLWVARVAGELSESVTYDIFDRQGVRMERSTFAAGSRVVAFGRDRVYVVRREGDGEVYLDRFPIG